MDDLTTREAAQRLGVSVRRVQALIKRGQLKAERKGRDWLIRPEDLDSFPRRPGGRPKTKKDTHDNPNAERPNLRGDG